MLTKPLDVNAVVQDVLLYTANQTRWYTDNIKMWLAEIDGTASLPGDDLRRQRLKEEIQIFFELILEYVMRCITHINKIFVIKAVRAVIQSESWWKQGLDKLKDHRATLEEHLKQTAEQKEKLRKRLSAQTKLIAIFRPDEDNDMSKVIRFNSNRAPHTCRWLRKHPSFQQWVTNGPKHLLVAADPGMGKTTLSAYLVQKVLPKYCVDTIILNYFFDHASRKDLSPALKTLLYQLFMAKPELAIDHEDEIERAEGNISGLSRILSKVSCHKTCPPLICVIDAIDECSDDGRRDLADFAEQLPSQSKLRFLMTTRSYPHIVAQLKGQRWSLISAEDSQVKIEVKKEIEIASNLKLSRFIQEKQLDAKTQSALSEAIREKGGHQTTYLWLKLLFMSLDDPDCDYRLSALKALVSGSLEGIDAQYSGMLQRVAPKSRQMLQTIFHLLIAAMRPLTVREVEIALRANARWDASDLEGDENDALEVLGPQKFHKWLRTCCHLFVTVNDDRVHFLHLTAQEFLLRGSGGHDESWYCVDTREAERVMVESCLPYLSLKQFSSGNFERQVRRSTQQVMTIAAADHAFGRNYGFLVYALQYWPGHFQEFQGAWNSGFPSKISQQLVNCYVKLFGSRSATGGHGTTPGWLLLCQWLQDWKDGLEVFRKYHGAVDLDPFFDGPALSFAWDTYGGAVARWGHYQMLPHIVPQSATNSKMCLKDQEAAACGNLLHMAVQGSALRSIGYLLSLPHVEHFIDYTDAFGNTPLASVKIATALVNHGADKYVLDDRGWLPICHLIVRILGALRYDNVGVNEYTACMGLVQRLMLDKETNRWK